MSDTNQRPRIGISLGDINGIGPEVIIKTFLDTRITELATPVVFGSSRVLSFYKKALKMEELNYTQVKGKGQFAPKALNVVNCWEDTIEIVPGKATPEAGRAAKLALKEATAHLKEGLVDALVTAPIDKHSVYADDFPYRGHTEFLAHAFGKSEPLMLMVSDAMRIALMTEHVPIHQVAPLITKERLEKKLQVFEHSLRHDFGISKPRIAVLGLNPHAGDGGVIGREEEDIIRPVLNEGKNKGRLWHGPYPADSFFAAGHHLKTDGVLAMYHDQGLIPFKSGAFADGVNFTAGLPVVRTSPDHGTAYTIAGKGAADETSFRNAFFLAADVVARRKEPM